MLIDDTCGALHGQVAGTVYFLLRLHVGQTGLGVVSPAATGYLIERNPDTLRAPDVGFVRSDRVPAGGPPHTAWPFAPDLAVEVVSPNDKWAVIEEKARTWLKAGTAMVWIVDSQGKVIHVHRADGSMTLLTTNDTLSGDSIVPGFSAKVSDLFALSVG